MAQIREELVLVDRFTNALTSYLRDIGRAEQATELANRQASQYSETQRQLGHTTDTLSGKIRNLAAAFLSVQAVKGLVTLSDTMTQTTARLDMMNDGLQTTAELNQMIYESAQRSRGSYQQDRKSVV